MIENYENRDHGQNVGGTRLWTDEQLIEMIRKILEGHMYRDVTEGTVVPMSTLWTRLLISYE